MGFSFKQDLSNCYTAGMQKLCFWGSPAIRRIKWAFITGTIMFVLRGLFTASFPWQLNISNDLKWISCFLSFLSSFIFNKEVPCCFCSCFSLHVSEWKCCVPQTCQKSSCHQEDVDILIPKRLHLQSCLAERRPIVCDQLLHISSLRVFLLFL